MERKIGEIFEYNGEWYQCTGGTCRNCCFYYDAVCKNIYAIGRTAIGDCHCSLRRDHKSVVFKRLEKVGEPYEYFMQGTGIILVQEYILASQSYICGDEVIDCQKDGRVAIEIKQTKEDMEENNNAKHSNSEKIGKNLKSFDLQAAKSGKPVCTRDGRKARIICFDMIGYRRPIIALVTNFDGKEDIETYYLDGRFSEDIANISDYDLMMLPEKKEGWVNVYKEPEGEYYMDKIIHKTEKFAFDVACPDDYIGTVKIEWYE